MPRHPSARSRSRAGRAAAIVAPVAVLGAVAATVLAPLGGSDTPAMPDTPPDSTRAVERGDGGARAERTAAGVRAAAEQRRAEQRRVEQRRDRFPEVEWRDSAAVGLPSAGSLVRGVKLPREGRHFFTWDPVERSSPNRPWRRWGTDRAVRATLALLAEHRHAFPRAPRLGVGDLSRPRGGDFGTDYGPIGHVSHQNGLDVDVYYPLRSGEERAPTTVEEIDLRLSQDLVDRFVAAGAEKVFVGPSTGLSGPADVVQAIPNHDNHIHARFPGDG